RSVASRALARASRGRGTLAAQLRLRDWRKPVRRAARGALAIATTTRWVWSGQRAALSATRRRAAARAAGCRDGRFGARRGYRVGEHCSAARGPPERRAPPG